MADPKKIKVGVVINRSKAGGKAVLEQMLAFVRDHPQIELLYEEASGLLIKQPGCSVKELAQQCQALIVAGGDGSLLDVVESVYPSQTPVLGINIGSLGFLTAVAQSQVTEMMEHLVQGALRLSPRLGLQTIHYRDGQQHAVVPCALNDVVISRASISRLIRVRVEIGDTFVTEYVCDGLIIATPTGSTAYSLAAGGPIVTPDAESVVLTPICPHTLTNRSLVVGTDAPIRISVPKRSGVPAPVVQYDGRGGPRLQGQDYLELRPAQAKVQLAYLPESNFFRVLRQKLKWSGSSI